MRTLWSVVVLLALVALPVAGRQAAGQAEADRTIAKFEAILVHAVSADRSLETLSTRFSEHELNAYLDVYGAQHFAPGFRPTALALKDGAKMELTAVVDFDAARAAQPRGWLDPLAYMSGTVAVRVVGTLRTARGKGTLSIESASLDGVAVPLVLLKQLVASYSRTPEFPQGFALDEPFELPARIRDVRIEQGQATVIQ